MSNELTGPFRNFLDSDGNTATDYLTEGCNWYQLKIRLHGIEYFVPLSIFSQEKCNELSGKCKLLWTLTLPMNNIQTERNKQRLSNDDLNTMYGTPLNVRASARRCMSIIKYDGQYLAIIDAVNSNQYHSGSEIMAIFMEIAVKKGINFGNIGLTDTSTKVCSKTNDRVSQSIFMAFMGRLDFYREWGFIAMMQTEYGYKGDRKKQYEFDAASVMLSGLKVSNVINAAIDDGVKDDDGIRGLIANLLIFDDSKQSAFMSEYLKQFSDEWDEKCDEYIKVIAALERIPTIKMNYLSRMRVRSTSLIWMKSELSTLKKRMSAVQNE